MHKIMNITVENIPINNKIGVSILGNDKSYYDVNMMMKLNKHFIIIGAI